MVAQFVGVSVVMCEGVQVVILVGSVGSPGEVSFLLPSLSLLYQCSTFPPYRPVHTVGESKVKHTHTLVHTAMGIRSR